jgi:hypothetical protein
MNIKNKYCLIIDLTKYQLDKLTDLMPESGLFDNFGTDTVIGFRCDGRAGTFGYDSGDTLISYTEMMQLLGKTMKEFAKSDLKAGVHFTKQRDGSYGLVMGGSLMEYKAVMSLNCYGENLIANNGNTHYDIVGVYRVNASDSLENHLAGKSLDCIWERTEQTPAQKEM